MKRLEPTPRKTAAPKKDAKTEKPEKPEGELPPRPIPQIDPDDDIVSAEVDD